MALKPTVGLRSFAANGFNDRMKTTHGKPATSFCIPVVLCGAPGVKTKILSMKKKGAWMQAPIEVSRRASGEVFLLDLLSHRMSVIEIFANL